MSAFRRFRTVLAAAALAWAAIAGFGASPALAQSVTVFSDDFESYTAGADLPTGGTNDLWAARKSGGSKETVEAGASTQFLYMRGGGGIFATTRKIDARGVSATLTFDLRYTGNNGDGTVDNPSDNGITFNELDASGDDLLVEYTTDGSTYSSIQTFAYNTTSYRTGLTPVTLSLSSAAFSSTLQIRFSQPSGGGANIDQWAVDNVALTVVTPEPGSAALFSLSAAVLAAVVVRRRRRAADAARLG